MFTLSSIRFSGRKSGFVRNWRDFITFFICSNVSFFYVKNGIVTTGKEREMEIILQLLLLVLGFVLLVKGADWFVDGTSGVARKLGIPQLVVGLTIVAMGTSAPEAAVSINAALKDGGMVITSVGTDSNGNGDTTFSSGGHFIVIRSLSSNGKWRILDSVNRPPDVNNTEWDPEFIVSQIRQHGSHMGWIVKKK
mgnify:CR=1 FL=1